MQKKYFEGEAVRKIEMAEKTNISKIFGENVFNDTVMQERLPKKIYRELKLTIQEGKELDLAVADVVAMR